MTGKIGQVHGCNSVINAMRLINHFLTEFKPGLYFGMTGIVKNPLLRDSSTPGINYCYAKLPIKYVTLYP